MKQSKKLARKKKLKALKGRGLPLPYQAKAIEKRRKEIKQLTTNALGSHSATGNDK